jgi:hypothetical protein
LSCKKNKLHPFYAHFAQGAQGAEATAIVAARLCGAAVSFVGHGYDAMTVPFELASNGLKVTRDHNVFYGVQRVYYPIYRSTSST